MRVGLVQAKNDPKIEQARGQRFWNGIITKWTGNCNIILGW
jgi:hypothetical protein